MAVTMRELPEEEKRQIMDEIACFFREEHDLDLGILGIGRIFEFFQETLGNRIYNQALKAMPATWRPTTMRCTGTSERGRPWPGMLRAGG